MALNTAQAPKDNLSAVVTTPKWQAVWNPERIHTLVILGIFLIWGTYRALENKLFETDYYASVFTDGVVPHYLSPFYSPPLHHLPGWPHWLSPSLFLLAFPGSFRFSCYFCRRTYYRAIFGSPPACAAKEVMRRATKYTGEREFPLYLNNLHRYTLYAIMVFVAFHWYHLIEAFHFTTPTGDHLGIGVGTIVFGIDAVMLTLYVTSCHSFRHLVGGIVNKFSNAPGRHAVWEKVTALNENHGLFFWLSLYSVGLADLYVRSVCAGVIHDAHFVLGGK